MISDCELCELVFTRNIYTKLHYEDETFLIVDCNTCFTPMVVLKNHRKSFKGKERLIIVKILLQLFGPTGFIDWKQRNIPDHAHCHLRKKPFPNSDAVALSSYL